MRCDRTENSTTHQLPGIDETLFTRLILQIYRTYRHVRSIESFQRMVINSNLARAIVTRPSPLSYANKLQSECIFQRCQESKKKTTMARVTGTIQTPNWA